MAKKRWFSRTPDAIDLLEEDHRRLEALLDAGEKTTSRAVKRRADILAKLTAQLKAHELIEEKVLYPALKPHAKARDIVLEGYQEHHVADVVLKELGRMRTSDERWGAKFKVLKENIEHHIEEEEGEMFKTARKVLSRDELQEFRTRMAEMKARALRGRR
jgi:hemerythrin-like domain-containing protein